MKANLHDLIDPKLLSRLNCERATAPANTIQSLAEDLRNYLTELAETSDYEKAIIEMENTKEWIVTFCVNLSESWENYSGSLDGVLDGLIKELTSTLEKSDYDFEFVADEWNGEDLALRYKFNWDPSKSQLNLPPYTYPWELLELATSFSRP